MVAYCKKIGIGWFSTVHDQTGLNFIKTLKPSFLKIASMDNGNSKLINNTIEVCKNHKVPLIVSLGGQNEKETDKLIRRKSFYKMFYITLCINISNHRGKVI